MSDATRNVELRHQPQEPAHRPSGFNPDDHGPRQRVVERANAVAFVLERVLDNLSRLAIQHRDRLLGGVQVAAYNSHLGLLRPECCEVWTTAQSTRAVARPTSL